MRGALVSGQAEETWHRPGARERGWTGGSLIPCFIMRLAACTASGALPAIFSAIPIAVDITSSNGTTWFTSPISRHSGAVSVSPVKMSSEAFAQPMSRGRIQVPPLSGTMPRLTIAALSLARSLMTRMSALSARSMPQPAALPFMAQISGVSIEWMMSGVPWR